MLTMKEINNMEEFDFNNIKYMTDLSSGATISQTAKLYKSSELLDYTTSSELTYADIVNMTLGLNIASEFFDVCGAVLVKNNSLTGAALGSTIFEAFSKAVDCNPIDALCGVVVLTKKADEELVKLLTPQHLIVAPEYSAEAENYLESKKIKYVKLNTPLNEYKNYLGVELFNSPFGTVVQNRNLQELNKDSFKVVSKTKPSVEQIEDAIFAWKVSKHLRSAGVVVAKDFKTTGLSQGIQNSAFEYAMNLSCDRAKEAVLAADVPMTVHDLNVAVQNRISLIIQPGVTQDVLKQADKFNVAVITTGISNFLIN